MGSFNAGEPERDDVFSNIINTRLGRRIPIRGKGQEKKTKNGKIKKP